VKARYEYVDSQSNDPSNVNPVVKMCRWLGVSTSGGCFIDCVRVRCQSEVWPGGFTSE